MYRTTHPHFQPANRGANIPVVTGSEAIAQDWFDLLPQRQAVQFQDCSSVVLNPMFEPDELENRFGTRVPFPCRLLGFG